MKRTYDNSGREARARKTRARIVATAHQLLLDGGYHGMTVAALAERAGVSPQTVYNSVGGKADVIRAVYDHLVLGDDVPLPVTERPAFRALSGAPDREAFVEAYAAWNTAAYQRIGHFLGALIGHGVGNDPALVDLMATIEAERRAGNGHAMLALRDAHGVPPHFAGEQGFQRLVDEVWVLTSPQVHDLLVRRLGWLHDAYEAWLARQLAQLVLEPA